MLLEFQRACKVIFFNCKGRIYMVKSPLHFWNWLSQVFGNKIALPIETMWTMQMDSSFGVNSPRPSVRMCLLNDLSSGCHVSNDPTVRPELIFHCYRHSAHSQLCMKITDRLKLKTCKAVIVLSTLESSHSRLHWALHGPKIGEMCPSFGESGSHLTQSCLGWVLSPYQVASWFIKPSDHKGHGPKIGEGCAPFWGWSCWVPI